METPGGECGIDTDSPKLVSGDESRELGGCLVRGERGVRECDSGELGWVTGDGMEKVGVIESVVDGLDEESVRDGGDSHV